MCQPPQWAHGESCRQGPLGPAGLCGLSKAAGARSHSAPHALHSLFPTMPRHNFHKVAPLVKSLCAKHSIQYQEKPLLRALQDIVR